MTVEYQKVWRTMNDLELVTSKICSAREIIDNAVDKIQGAEYDKAELLMNAAYEFLEYYLQEFDDKFKLAWQATVGDLRDGDVKKESWNSFWESYRPEESQQYTEEELNAMCDKAELDAEVEKIRQEGGYDWTPVAKKEEKTLNYDEAIAAGWTMTDDGIWMPPQETPKKKWVLTIEQNPEDFDYYVLLPDGLLEAAKLKEGDEIKWVDNGNGSYTIVKVTKPLGPDEC